MNEARFRFYAKLNNFLPQENRGKELTRYFNVSVREGFRRELRRAPY